MALVDDPAAHVYGMAGDEPWVEALNDRVEEWSIGLATHLVLEGVCV